jgi:hypothetical protein
MAKVFKGARIWMRIKVEATEDYPAWEWEGEYKPVVPSEILRESDPDKVAASLFEEMMTDSGVKVERLDNDGCYALTLPAETK